MGALAGLFGFTGASTAAANSLGWSAASTGLNAVGDVLSGIGASQQGSYQAAVARNNAIISGQNADADLLAGQLAESQSKLRTGLLAGEQRAAQGANGIDVNVGSPTDVINSTRTIGAMDAALIHYNASRAAFGEQQTAANFTAQSELDKKASSNALLAGLFKGGLSVLSGASSLGAKYANYKLSGAQ